MTSIVADSTCLIGLERIDCLYVLQRSISNVIIPQAVQQEWGHQQRWISAVEIQNISLARSLKMQVDAGESEVITLGVELETPVILDDRKARNLARAMGLTVIGTIGLIVRAKRQGIIPACGPILDSLVQADFRISETLLREALRLADEE